MVRKKRSFGLGCWGYRKSKILVVIIILFILNWKISLCVGWGHFAKFSDMYQKIFYIHKKLCVTVCGFTFSGMSSSSLVVPFQHLPGDWDKKESRVPVWKAWAFYIFHHIHICFFSSSSSTNGEKWYKCFFFSSVIIIHSDVIFMLWIFVWSWCGLWFF